MAHNSSTSVKVKFAPRSLRSFAGMLNTAINLLYKTLASLCHLIFCDDSQGVMHKVVSNDQHVLDAWWFIQFHS